MDRVMGWVFTPLVHVDDAAEDLDEYEKVTDR